jgi:type IV pilus assembly protein PilW
VGRSSPWRGAFGSGRAARGFTLVELMVAVVIGLLTTVVIAQVLFFSEGQKRTTTSGSDAQINGAQAMYSLQRDIQMAGYGFASSPNVLGCPIHAKFNGADVATGAAAPVFPVTLAPVQIDSTNADRNSLRILSSSKLNYAIPSRILPSPGGGSTASYDPAVAGLQDTFTVASTLGIQTGDLLLAGKADGTRCDEFAGSFSAPPVDGQVKRLDTATWNPAGFPDQAYADGDVLVNLGTLIDHRYAVSANNALQLFQYSTASPTSAPVGRELYPNVVNLQAFYGKDTTVPPDGIVDVYDHTTPTTTSGWRQVMSVRVAVVARSSQYEKDIVTPASPLWDVGTTQAVAGTAACGASQCLSLNVATNTVLDEWKHYRYKVFDTVIPLRNMLWTSCLGAGCP